MKFQRIPTRVGEINGFDIEDSSRFPFQSWADMHRFKYPEAATPFLSCVGSAAEAFFIRPFTLRAGFTISPDDRSVATAGGLIVGLQLKCRRYYIDAAITDGLTKLAVEIDGIAWHHWTKEQVAKDYLRERRIVLEGYTVIRFTAQEVFKDADECWRQISAILSNRKKN